MVLTSMGFAMLKNVWDYYTCEEPQWSPSWWIYGRPENVCPDFFDVVQVLSLYVFILCVFCFLLPKLRWSRSQVARVSGWKERVSVLTGGGKSSQASVEIVSNRKLDNLKAAHDRVKQRYKLRARLFK